MIDEVTYDSAPPWPIAANGFGPSLQLIDPYQDNDRVMNWAVVATNAPAPTPLWQYVTVTGNAPPVPGSMFISMRAAISTWMTSSSSPAQCPRWDKIISRMATLNPR